MAILISNVNSTTDTFSDWLDKTNQVLDNLSTKIVTSEANSSGGQTTGNVNINGIVSANTIAAVNSIRGGTVDLPNTLFIASNTAFTNATSNVLLITTNATSSILTSNIGTVTFNVTNANFVGGTLTVTSNAIFSNDVTINDVLTVNSTSSLLGNTAVGTNTVFVDTTNKRVVVYGTDTSNTTNRLEVNGNTLVTGNLYVTGLLEAETIAANTFNISGNIAFSGTSNGNFIPTTNSFSLGNTTNRWALFGTSGNFANDVTISGNLTVNSTFNVGANLSVNSTSIFIGNSTVNTTISAGNVQILGSRLAVGNSSVNTTISGNSLSTGNTTVTGFANISSTLAAGNTTVTGFANISSTLAAGNTTVTGFVNISSTLAAGNTTITGQANVSSTLGVGLDIVLQGEVGANTTQVRVGNSTSNSLILFNQVRVGNTTVNTTVNPQTINVGANVSVNVSAIKVGNSTVNTVITGELITGNGASITSLNANNFGSGTLPILRGGTGAASAGDALTNLLPAGAVAGYVLTTGGPGSYYWAAGGGGGGGGGSIGTTINSSRLSYTANGTATVFTTPTYVPGASQLRIYIDGVRQFTSAYTETSNTSVTFLTAPPNSSAILVEVDGYIDNPIYANNVAFTAPFGSIPSGANTIQLAIQDLETRKATLASPAFTGNSTFSNVAVNGTAFTGPTPATSSNTTDVATTAFVRAVLNSGNTFTLNISGTATSATSATNATNATNANNATFVNTHSVGQSLLTSSNAQFRSLGINTAASGTAGEIRATNNITAYYSDERLKLFLGKIESSLEKLNQLNGYYFKGNEVAASFGYDTQERQVGVSAQEVQSVLPEVVKPAPIDDKYLTVQYEKLVPLLIEAIKELNQKVENLEEKLRNDN